MPSRKQVVLRHIAVNMVLTMLMLAIGLGLFACASPEQTTPGSAPEASPSQAAQQSPQSPQAAQAAAPAQAEPPATATSGDAHTTVNAHGVSIADCRTVCAHVLLLSLQALPEDVPPAIREEHMAKVTRDCPTGCMREATPASNACVLKAKAAQDMAACQP